jgi:hypothetical protein
MSESPIDVETIFDAFVVAHGGEIVSHLLPKVHAEDNADYLFRTDSIVAELKRLDKNFYGDAIISRKFREMFGRWISDGLVSPSEINPRSLNLEALPRKCQNDVFKALSGPVKRHVAKANSQIKLTKRHFGLPNAKGLLLLVNDGNYILEHDYMMHIFYRLLKSCYTSIDGFIYFTVNVRASLGGLENLSTWISGHSRENVNEIPLSFFEGLRRGWISHLEQATSQAIPQFVITDHGRVSDIKLTKKPLGTGGRT